MYHGDIRLNETIDIKFTTRRFSTGAPYTLAGSPVISAYVGNGTTEITAGITLTVDFDSRTGLNNVRVVATSGNGFATATNVSLVITTGTVDSVSVVGEVVGTFSIENRSALMPTTAARTLDVSAGGEAGVDWANVGSPTTTVGLSGTTVKTATDVETDTADIQSRIPAALVGGRIDSNVGAISSDATAADNAEAFFDGTGYAGTGNTIPTVTTVTNGVTLANGAHGGTSTVITAERIVVASTTAGQPALKLTGNTTGAGLLATGGNSGGAGIYAAGGTSGHGIFVMGDANDGIAIEAGTNSHGIEISGGGTGDGILARGGATGDGFHAYGGATSGNGINITTTDGHGVNIAATGTNRHGILATGGNGGTSDGVSLVAGTGGVGLRAGSLTVTGATTLSGAVSFGSTWGVTGAITFSSTWTGNITGNLSGSVGSVTGAVGSVTGNVGGNVTGSVGSLATQAKADVNAEVLDVLNTDTFAEPGQEAPAATNTLAKKIGYLFKLLRNKLTQSATELKVYADDGTTVDQKATISDDGTTYTRGEIGTGP